MWFRRDLRLGDNRALASAIASGSAIVPIFILDEQSHIPERLGSAARWWLHHSLSSLGQALRERGGELILKRGNVCEILRDVCARSDAVEVFINESYSPQQAGVDRDLEERLRMNDIALHRSSGHLLHPPETIRSLSGQPYRVFTPFWRAMSAGAEPPRPIAAPETLHFAKVDCLSDTLDDWQLLPTSPNWAAEFAGEWYPGEAAALDRLDDFVTSDIDGYSIGRDIPAKQSATSRLSPHLAFGEISPATIWHATSRNASASQDRTVFRKELAWRDFCYCLLQAEPRLAETNWNRDFDRFEWQIDAEGFDAWKRGMTGYPIVDAGMRQLWRHGTMHNRVRMIVASFLIKHLLIDWREGEKWFSDTLVDMDVANNPANWQWVAGSGADASPFFRIFNPILQGEKFDKQGTYVRRFVPELSALPDKYIHRPFDAPQATLDQAGITPGTTYPKPIIDHQFARQRALAAYSGIKHAN